MKTFYKFCITLTAFYLLLIQVANARTESYGRVINGEDDEIANCPYLVQLYVDGLFHCGGALVSDLFVITAANCVAPYLKQKKPQDHFKIKAGASRVHEPGIIANVSLIIIPELYNNSNLNMDVAVIKLAGPLVGPLIQPITINFKNPFQPGDSVIVRGWGDTTRDFRIGSNQLKSTKLFVVNKKECEHYYQNLIAIPDTTFCAAAPGTGFCFGDSGSPVLVNGEYTGLVSNAGICAGAGLPGYFTNFMNPRVRRFIKAAMKK